MRKLLLILICCTAFNCWNICSHKELMNRVFIFIINSFLRLYKFQMSFLSFSGFFWQQKLVLSFIHVDVILWGWLLLFILILSSPLQPISRNHIKGPSLSYSCALGRPGNQPRLCACCWACVRGVGSHGCRLHPSAHHVLLLISSSVSGPGASRSRAASDKP